MIELLTITPNNMKYIFVELLILIEFPENERSDADLQRQLLRAASQVQRDFIETEFGSAAFFTWWNFRDFAYMEHFAIAPEFRCMGVRGLAMKELKAAINLPIVLEVELPVQEDARRRINFYRRCGFELWQQPYFQPPYREMDQETHMRLMGTSCLAENALYPDLLRQEVYGCASRNA